MEFCEFKWKRFTDPYPKLGAKTDSTWQVTQISKGKLMIYASITVHSAILKSGNFTTGTPITAPTDSLNGIALWLDATNIDGKQNTTLTNGSNVSEWKDMSGNMNHGVQ